MRPYVRSIDINALAQRVEVDNRISLPFYFRIADNLLKQARIYREEKNIIDLYIILLRYSSLLCETIPCHHEYQALPLAFKEKLLAVMNELESLKPEVQRRVDELNREHMILNSSQKRISTSSAPAKTQILSNSHIEQMPVSNTSLSSWRPSNNKIQIVSPNNLQTERSFQKISLGLLHPKEETLSRHSILGSNGLWGPNARPITGRRVQYPSNSELIQDASSRLIQDVQSSSAVINEGDSRKNNYDLDSVLSLDDGRWSIAVEESDSIIKTAAQEDFAQLNIRQPSPPPVLAEVQPQLLAIPPSRVADPRPGPANPSQEETKSFQHLHVPVKMMESFLRLAEKNTFKNLETCGILAGALKNRMFYVTTLIIPKQESTSDSCQTTDEEEIFNVQDKLSLFPLGWIHTHPTQTCFMSSIDLHTHYSYQIMLPEAIAIVMAPTDTSRTHGIFHLTDPTGVNLIRNCQERGFHPHEEPLDGTPIYEHSSHVYMNTNMKFDVIDLRSL
ncbi:AMSH-like ubiquitin thioesterase 3 [Zingiber officinale]|uniref:AMSH-like ubiquitin thioesterase 3 n=1 Tax=Zingiber officinale TaxID=94328 RepID=UPI001C4A7CAC|nr:AMSH-like ubiquitin thioesterase 3 [Zingiber officinale]